MRSNISALYQCSPAPHEGVRIRTPFLYPDGGIVDVFVVEDADGYTVTDFGDALGWLRNQTIRDKLSPRQRRLLNDISLTLGVGLQRGQLRHRCIELDDLASSVQMVGQAAVRVADLWFTFQTRTLETVADEVDDWLREREICFEKGFKSRGRSGRQRTVDYKISTPSQISLVFLLSTGSKAATRRLTERVFTGCADLKNAESVASSHEFVSLFDDSVDVWQPYDFRLLENVSHIARWSNREELEDILKVST